MIFPINMNNVVVLGIPYLLGYRAEIFLNSKTILKI